MVQVTQYRNTTFDRRVLYCAWDNLRDEKVFFEGISKLETAGIPPSHVRAYMLIGFDNNETRDRIWYRFKRMIERDIEPYPMVFHKRGHKPRTDLKCFQRWDQPRSLPIRSMARLPPPNQKRRKRRGMDTRVRYLRATQKQAATISTL